MPDDLVDHWAAPPRRETGSGRERDTLVRRMEHGVPRVIGPALVTASALLVAGQLLSAYRTVWPSDVTGQFQQGSEDLAAKVAYLIGSPFAVPLISASLPVLVLAGLARPTAGDGVPVGPRLRLAARVTTAVVGLVGMVLFVGTAVWTVITHGVVGSGTDGMGLFVVDPVVTFLTRGGDGLETAVLAGVAGWLLRTRSADGVTADVATAGTAEDVAETVAGAVGSTVSTPSSEVATPEPPADAASGPGAAAAGSPAPFVTRGASEPSWPRTDPTVFRRPSTGTGQGPEPTPDGAEPASTDPALLFRRPVR